jgi:replicative DNA helicase
LGLDLGFPLLQNAIGQFRNGSVSFFAASTKQGKSIFGLTLGLMAARKHNIPVLLLDSELNKNDQLIRAVGHLAKVPFNVIETGIWRLTDAELEKQGIQNIEEIQLYRNRLNDDYYWQVVEKLPIEYVSISGMSVEETIPHIKRWLLTKVKPNKESKIPQCLIIYDYIKLAHRNEIRGMAEWQAHGLNVASLHDLAQRYNVPIVTFGQTNNEIDNGIHCIAGGKRIIENVTSITYFKRKTDEERSIDPLGTHYWKNWGARYGKGTPGGHINFDADLSIGDFTELGVGSFYVPKNDNSNSKDDI